MEPSAYLWANKLRCFERKIWTSESPSETQVETLCVLCARSHRSMNLEWYKPKRKLCTWTEYYKLLTIVEKVIITKIVICKVYCNQSMKKLGPYQQIKNKTQDIKIPSSYYGEQFSFPLKMGYTVLCHLVHTQNRF